MINHNDPKGVRLENRPHKAFVREVSQSTTAVLCIHGIVGTPDHFQRFIPVIPKEWSIYNMLLDGHGAGVKEFAQTSMAKWRRQVNQMMKRLTKRYENIVIVAHSMGTLFAMEMSLKYKQKVKLLFLLDPPMRIGVRPEACLNAVKIVFNCVSESDRAAMGMKAAYGIEPDWRLWRYLGWIPRYLELFYEVHRARKWVSQINVPCYAYFSRKDELVHKKAYRFMKINPGIHLGRLEQSGHFWYDEKDWEYLLQEFSGVLGNMKRSTE